MKFRTIAGCIAVIPLVLAACSSGSDDNGGNSTKYLILGNAMSARLQNVYIQKGTTAQPGLTVTVNGVALTNSSGGQYSGTLPVTLPVGGAVQLVVTDGIVTATGNAVVPSTPTVTNATVASHGAPVTITWSITSSPDSFSVALNYHLPDGSAGNVLQRVAGSVRQVTLAQTDIPPNGTVFSVGLQAFNPGTFTGAAAAGSNMGLRASAPEYPFTVP